MLYLVEIQIEKQFSNYYQMNELPSLIRRDGACIPLRVIIHKYIYINVRKFCRKCQREITQEMRFSSSSGLQQHKKYITQYISNRYLKTNVTRDKII
jgi:hypothetical protein